MTNILQLDLAWRFRRLASAGATSGEAWSNVDLPHSPFPADLDGREHWFGECEYERTITLPANAPAGPCLLHVGAAMHSAIVLVDNRECGRHSGGFLPFEIDLTNVLRDGKPHTLTLRLDNRDNPDVPPGKPYSDLDFCWYGGLYREVELRCAPALHITDAVGAATVAGGGIFICTLSASVQTAVVSVTTHVRNAGPNTADFVCEVELKHQSVSVSRAKSKPLTLPAGASTSVTMELTVDRPALWQIDSPSLHHAVATVRLPDGETSDTKTERFGIRRISFSRSGGFALNNRRLRLRGTNRHQEYPRVGYAAPEAVQRRDARLIKEAGFDYVRLSHYPQSPHFLDACDELGIVVMNCIPGWQFIGGAKFQDACEQNARDLIRRDRNHPCVVLWELSLNETAMSDAFMERMHRAGHEEYPGDQLFTCGWEDRYDVYIHSRQHGEIHRWKNGDKALVVAEYGDWEFFASNHGFDQKTGAGIYKPWSTARQRRRDGERALGQQASNHTLALNDTLSSPAVLDGQWSAFDYARGYDAERASCGVMDIFRLPKFSYYFYRSQRDADEPRNGWSGGPLVFIASHWTPASDLRVVVFTNCEEVELTCNGHSLGRQRVAKIWMTQYLPHPPFVFDLPAFTVGTLTAIGFLAGKKVATHSIATPGTPAQIALEVADNGIKAKANTPDVVIVHARVLDPQNTLCISDDATVIFTLTGDAEIVGPNSVAAEAGIASVVIRIASNCCSFHLHAFRKTVDSGFENTLDWSRG